MSIPQDTRPGLELVTVDPDHPRVGLGSEEVRDLIARGYTLSTAFVLQEDRDGKARLALVFCPGAEFWRRCREEETRQNRRETEELLRGARQEVKAKETAEALRSLPRLTLAERVLLYLLVSLVVLPAVAVLILGWLGVVP